MLVNKDTHLDPYVIIATKGRAEETCQLVASLAAQTLKPRRTIFVGTEQSDVAGIEDQPGFAEIGGEVVLSDKAGLTIQRNVGLERLISKIADRPSNWFVSYFDDDFRPSSEWIESVCEVFTNNPSVVGLTGQVLADGIHGEAISEEDAITILSQGKIAGQSWAQWPEPRSVTSVYGCNMAFRDCVSEVKRFDENLLFYGWQEDRDYTGQAMELGEVIYHPAPKGVHLGVKGGRSSGKRLGYSQIANPIYLSRKGTMDSKITRQFLMRALAANTINSIRQHKLIDYRGRFIGNLLAVTDLLKNKIDPRKIAQIH